MSNNKPSYPFYANPMGHKRSIQIIKETKAEIKKMESHRPSTPFSRKKIETEYYFPVSSRPASSSSIKSLKYENEDDYLPARKLNIFSAAKKKSMGSEDLKLEPLVTKSIFTSKKSASTNLRSHPQNDVIFPPITNDEKDKKSVESPLKNEVLLQNLENMHLDSHNNIISPDLYQETCQTTDESVFVVQSDDPVNKTLTDELSHDLKQILFILEKNTTSGKRKSEEEQTTIVCKLYNILKEKNAFQRMDYQRTPILKLLFKLLDSNFPDLSFHVIKILLEMKVKYKNLSNIYRLMLKIMNSHQVNLNKYDIKDTLLDSIHELSPENNKETVLHGVQILKLLLFKNKLDREDLEKAACILLNHLTQFNDMMPSPEQRCDDVYIELNKHIFTTLHYLIQEGQICQLISSEKNLSEILKSLSFFYQNSDVIQILVRLISKVIDSENGCQAVAQCPQNLIMSLSLILQTHKYNIDITLQTTFIVANMILVDENLVAAFLNLHHLLVDILEEYVKEHVQVKRTISHTFKHGQGDSSENCNWRHDVFEVISQILCIFANICLNADAGHFLAQEEDIILRLLNIIGIYLNQEVPNFQLYIYSFLVVIGNISYYLKSDSTAACKIARCVIPLLDDHFHLEVKQESANIIHNLTRSPEVRKCIQEYSLLPAFVRLLNENDKEFNIVSYGIIMNLLLDKNNHNLFYKEQGITKILHKLHLCTDRDWKTSSMLCQILWNYCKCLKDDDNIPISKIEAQHLIKYLSYSTNKVDVEEDGDSHQIWKNEFCPVAKQLLLLLQSKNSPVT